MTGEKPRSLARRLLWFAALWLGGVGSVAHRGLWLEAVDRADLTHPEAAPHLIGATLVKCEAIAEIMLASAALPQIIAVAT